MLENIIVIGNKVLNFQVSTLDRKKKNFSFSRRFPFMKSKDDKNEDGSDQERKYYLAFPCLLHGNICEATTLSSSRTKENYKAHGNGLCLQWKKYLAFHI